MPNILKRPMFRKGGSAAEGTGITTGLTNRQNYSEAGAVLPTIQERYEELKPSPETTVSDFITALGATAPQDPTKLQTFGQVLSQAGTTASGLRRQREETAEKFKSEAINEVIKNLTKGESDQLIRRAKMWAQTQRAAGKDMTDEQAIAIWLNAAISQGSPYLKGQSPQDRILNMAKDYSNPDGEFGFSPAGAQQVSKIIVAYQDGNLPPGIQEKFKGPIDQEGALIATEDGGYEFRDMKQLDEIYYTPNKIYVNPDDGQLYEYIGEGQFQKVNQ